MKKEIKTFLKEDEADDIYVKGDVIWFRKMKGVVLWTTHYVIVAEYVVYSWREKLKNWWMGR